MEDIVSSINQNPEIIKELSCRVINKLIHEYYEDDYIFNLILTDYLQRDQKYKNCLYLLVIHNDIDLPDNFFDYLYDYFEENGGYINYGITNETPYNAFYDIYNKGQDNHTNIEWNRTTKEGRVKDAQHFLDAVWHLWDSNLDDQ